MLNISSERSEDDGGCGSVEDVTKVAIKALMDIIKITVYNGVANDWSLPCLGKILCLGKYLLYLEKFSKEHNSFCQSLFKTAKKTAAAAALCICLNVVSCNQSKLLIISAKTN